ncbi:hypothetical protein [Methanocaldococcus sp.]
MIKKIKSNRGIIFTFEAVIVAFIFLTIFFLGYSIYSHNLLTGIEEKKDTEKFHKALLLIDLFLKKYEFPGNYSEDYIQNFTDELNLKEKTFDPINNFTNDSDRFIFIIYPNKYDNILNNYVNLSNITFNFSGIIFKIYSNVSNVNNISINLSNIKIYDWVVFFKENVYIPKITGITYNSNVVYLYGCEGDHIYFKIQNYKTNNINISNVSAKLLNYTGSSEVIFSINGYIYNKSLNSSFKNINEIIPNIISGINKIEILYSPVPVEFKIKTTNVTKFYYLTLSPRNITIMVNPND